MVGTLADARIEEAMPPAHDSEGDAQTTLDEFAARREAITQEQELIRARYEQMFSLSPYMREILVIMQNVAPTISNVLLLGESGTGKNLIAKAIHDLSNRRKGPFYSVSITGLPETLMESELFGHARGAFTGAVGPQEGKFQHAEGGTLLLDEIGEVPLSIQPKLLAVLQDRKISRLGENREISINVRFISATNQDLEALVKEGRFRKDLYYRINTIPIYVPPLRYRKEEIQHLVEQFLDGYAQQYGRGIRFSRGALEELIVFDWPGNVRQLQQFVERAVVVKGSSVRVSRKRYGNEYKLEVDYSDAPELTREDVKTLLKSPLNSFSGSNRVTPYSKGTNDDHILRLELPLDDLQPGLTLPQLAERELIKYGLRESGGKPAKAALFLCMNRQTMYNKMCRYGLR